MRWRDLLEALWNCCVFVVYVAAIAFAISAFVVLVNEVLGE